MDVFPPIFITNPAGLACQQRPLLSFCHFQIIGRREKFNSLHFPETENGCGFDSRSNTRRCVLQLMAEYTGVTSCVVSLSQIFITAGVIAMSQLSVSQQD